MSYSKQTWTDGDATKPVSAARMQHIEDGLDAVANGSQTAPSYRLVSDGAIVTAFDKTGVTISSGADGGAVLTAVFAAMPAAGCSIAFRNDGNVFPWSTTPKIPVGITSKLLIQGGGSKIQLSSAAPTFLGLNRTADYQTVQNVEIADFVIDRNNVATVNGAPVVFGNGVATNDEQRLNFNHIILRRIRTVNVPTNAGTSSPNHNIRIVSYHAAAAETQTNTTDILVEDCDFAGGNYGVSVMGLVSSGNACNVFCDKIIVQRIKHDTLSLSSATSIRGDEHVHIGGNGFGGTCVVRDIVGANSGDTGIEINAMTDALIESFDITDAWSQGVLLKNFSFPQYPAAQKATLRHGRTRVLSLDGTKNQNLRGFTLGGGNNYGNIVLEDCEHHDSRTAIFAGDLSGWAIACISAVNRLVLRDLTVRRDSLNDATSATRFIYAIQLWPSSNCEIVLQNVRFNLAGVVGSGIRERIFSIGATGNNTIGVDADGISYALSTTGYGGASRLRLLEIGGGVNVTTLRCLARHLTVSSYTSDDTNPLAVTIYGTTFLTITGQLRLEDIDVANLSGTAPINFDTSGASNATSTNIIGLIQQTFPISVLTITPSGSPFTWQNTLGYQTKLFVFSGTVSLIEWSQDGATYRTIATATNTVPIIMDSGDYIRVTYTVAPTMRAYQTK